jgi:hypothetical protein
MSSDNPPSFAKVLDEILVRYSMGPARLAERTGVPVGTIRRWLTGARPVRHRFEPFVDALDKFVDGVYIQNLKDTYHGTIQGFTVVNVDRVIKGFTNAPKPPPSTPTQSGPGPGFRPTSAGFDVEVNPPPDAERANPVQISLHRRLQRHIERLRSAVFRIENEHRMLAAEFADYTVFLSADLADLDVTSLWSVGTGLSEQVTAIVSAGPNVIAPEIEPDVLAEFRGLLRDHTAFVNGFAVGRELHERVIRGREAAEDNPKLQVESASVLNPMTAIPRLLAEKAKRMVQALTRALAATPTAAFDLLASSTDVARNSIVAFARLLHPILVASETTNLALLIAGQEHPEVLQAAVVYFRDNIVHVMALYANDQQIADWLSWMALKLHDLEI